MTIVVKSIFRNSDNSSLYIPNQIVPFLCVFIIAKTPTVLLVSFFVGYIMLVQPKKKQLVANREMKMIEASSSLSSPPPLSPLDESDNLILNYSSDEEDDDINITPNRKLSPVEDNNSSIEFENLLKFPSCPTTLPRLDTHFNFVADHDIHSPNPSEINWSIIHQEMEYDQQRQEDVIKQEKSQQKLEDPSLNQSQHPLLLLHQLQQDNLSMVFTDDELSSVCIFKKPICLDDAAILYVDNDTPYNYYSQQQQQNQLQKDGFYMEDLLLLPLPKQSTSSPGQMFKSKFQKAVSKMKKTSNLVGHKQDNSSSKRSSVISNDSTIKPKSLRLNSQQDPLFSSTLSPRPSASARVHDHLKGRFNKMFKK